MQKSGCASVQEAGIHKDLYLMMVVREIVVSFNHGVQIRLHQFKHYIDILEGPWIRGQ